MILNKQFLNEQFSKHNAYEFVSYRSDKTKSAYDIFISYSWNDRLYANKIVQLLKNCGYSVYVDFDDYGLNNNHIASQETAKHLLNEMNKCKCLLYLHSKNSSLSKWCPWEVGVFSGIKDFKCANLPLTENCDENFKNQEYLDIYPYIEYEKTPITGKYDFWVCESKTKYINLRSWVDGSKPYEHSYNLKGVYL